MATRLFSTLVPTIAASVPGCPTPTIIKHIRDAAIEACERTLMWRYRCAPVNLLPLQSTYNYADAFSIGAGTGGSVETTTLDTNYTNYQGFLSNDLMSYEWNNYGSYGCSYGTIARSSGKYFFQIKNTTVPSESGGGGPV